MITVPATDADIGDIVALVNSAYRGEGAGWTNEVGLLAGPRTDPATLAVGLGAGNSTLLLMRDHEGAQLAGCVLLEPAGDTATWHLGMLTVDPRRQAEGLGRTLLSKAEDYVREQGAACVQIDRHRAPAGSHRMVRKARLSPHRQNASLFLMATSG